MISANIYSILAQTQDSFYTDYATVHLDKTDSFLGDYVVVIGNTDTGVHLGNIYTDTKDSSQYIKIPGNIEASSGQTLWACAMQMDTQEVACDKQIANGMNTEFYINMANRVPLQNNGEFADKYKGDLSSTDNGNNTTNTDINNNMYDSPIMSS